MQRRLSRLLLLAALVAIPAADAFAGDLKVLDQDGMTRAEKTISAPAEVEARAAAAPATAKFVLSQSSGLSNDIEGSFRDGRIVFPGVPEGTWQIKCLGCRVQLIEVSIR